MMLNAKEKNLIKFCIVFTFVFGLAAHAFQFLNFQYSHDSFDGLYFPGRETVHKIGLGRVFIHIYRSIFLGEFSIPWMTGMLGLLWIAGAAFFVIKCLDIENNLIKALICGIMATNHTVIATAATFIHDFDANMFGMMLCCFAVYLWKNKKRIWIIIGAAAIAISLGIYQSYISVSIVLILLVLLQQILDNEKISNIIKNAFWAMTMGFGSILLYVISLKWMTKITNVGYASRGNSITALSALGEENILIRVKDCYKTWFEYFKEYKTNWISDGLIYNIHIAIILIAIGLVVYLMVRNKISKCAAIFCTAIVLLLPLAMNMIYIISVSTYHDLMKYGMCFIYIIALMLADRCKINPARTVTIALVGIIVFCEIQTANLVYLKKNLTYQATYAQMTYVLHDIIDLGYEPENTTLCVTGMIDIEGYDEFEDINRITGANHENVITKDEKSIDHYFDYVLGYPVNVTSDSEFDEIISKQEYIDMPVFPEKGYVDYIDNVLVVKLMNIE